MKCETPSKNSPRRAACCRQWRRAVLLLLLFAVPGLSTLAKNSWYLPQSNLGYYLSPATKIEVVRPVVVFDRALLLAIVEAILPEPENRTWLFTQIESSVSKTDFTTSPQPRPRPPTLA
jgi:hypothetical protein